MRPRIAILLRLHHSRDRQVMFGIAQAAAAAGGWLFQTHPHSLFLPIPDMRRWRGEGVIGRFDNGQTIKWAEAQTARGVPVIHIGEPLHRWRGGWISTDNRAVGRMAGEYLLSQGHTHGVWVSSNNGQHFQRRAEGFTAVLHEAGVHVSTHHNTRHMTTWLKALPRPAGVACGNDGCASQVIQAADSLNLQVPDDLSVMGAGNDELLCEASFPTITSLATPYETLGRVAGNAMSRCLAEAHADVPRQYLPPRTVISRQSTDTVAEPDPILRAAMRLIQNHPDRILQVEDVLAQLPEGVSRRTLERRFQQRLGQTPRDYITNARVRHIQQLLLGTNWSISHIAAATGFPSSEGLSAFFRRQTGTTATQFRSPG